jgi:Zn-dependent peptidase ImmA (M78 family)
MVKEKIPISKTPSLTTTISKQKELENKVEFLVAKYCEKVGIKKLPVYFDKRSKSKLADFRSHTDSLGNVHPAIHINYSLLEDIYNLNPEKADEFLEYAIAHEVAHAVQLEKYGLEGFAWKPQMLVIEPEADEIAYNLLGYKSKEEGEKRIDEILEYFKKESEKRYGIKPKTETIIIESSKGNRLTHNGKIVARVIGWESTKAPFGVVIPKRPITEENWEYLIPKKAKKIEIIEFDERGYPLRDSNKTVSREELKNYYLTP